MKTLLHICCAPCACGTLPRLGETGAEAVLFFSNSNIDAADEFDLRFAQAEKLSASAGVELLRDGYDHGAWLEGAAKGFEDAPEKGERCRRCFLFNMRRAASRAKELGCDAFTTTLTVSPHKISKMVFEAGRKAGAEYGVEFLEIDFKKRGGFLESLRRSAALGLYRQNYCGCEFSKAAAAVRKDRS